MAVLWIALLALNVYLTYKHRDNPMMFVNIFMCLFCAYFLFLEIK